MGGWNTAFGFFVFTALYFTLHRAVHYIAILIGSYIISITNAYICYKFFVFKTKGNYIKEYLRFYLVYGIAFLVNIVTLPLAVELLKMSPIMAQAAILFITICLSYFGHKRFTFGHSLTQFNPVDE